MKSKTKTILIFAAILAAVFLIAFLDGGAVQSAADEEEEGTLIGAFVSEEDIDIGGDLAVSAAGKFVWKAGRLYMETDDWSALGERGGGIYCTMEPDARYGEEDAKSPNITIFGALGAPLGKAGIDDDNGVRTTDIDLSGEVYACGDRQVIFNFYPIYQTSDGRIYLTRGNSMGKIRRVVDDERGDDRREAPVARHRDAKQELRPVEDDHQLQHQRRSAHDGDIRLDEAAQRRQSAAAAKHHRKAQRHRE